MNSDGSQSKKGGGGRSQSLVAPQSPSVKRTSSFRRNGSLGKGSPKTTTPQRPMLATEARSLIRPCGCGKDGVFKAHGHTHDSHHRVPVTPERTLREPKTPKSPQVVRKSRATSAPQEQQEKHSLKKLPEPSAEPLPLVKPASPPPSPTLEVPQSPISSEEPPHLPSSLPSPQPKEEENESERTVPPPTTPKPVIKSTFTPDPKPLNKDKGFNRFVSTVVWYPEQKPEFNSTTLTLLPGEDSARYVDEILLKEYDTYFRKNFPHSAGTQGKLQNETYYSKQVVSESSALRGGSLVPPKMTFNPVSVS